MENRNNNPRMVSLFSGCGGLDLGFIQAGFDVVWANDFDTDAQAVYRLNIGEIDGRDILEVDEKEIPDCDILTAGFPCQPFSNAGSRRGVHDSRGMLYKECLRIIEEKMPKVIVFENVKGILSTNHINGRKLVDTIVEDLWDMNGIGYEVNYQLINASDYGVPQNRQRVLFVGVRKDLGMQFQFPEKQEKKNLTLEHILNIPKDVPNQVDWPLSPQALEMIQYIPEGGSWKNVPYEHLAPRFKRIRDNMKRYHSPNFYRRFARNEICGTMTASAQPENCGIVHPTENRRFTIREVARIQTFPDTFLFLDDSVKNVTAMYKVIGNAVPVKLANVLATAIREQVFQRKESTMDTDKAYLLGLIIGGGIWGNAEDIFRIRLPFKQWGSYESNPRRAGEISRDVMKMVSPLFRAIYNISVSYDTSASGVWNILCEGDLTQLREELEGYGITCEGEVRKTANINHIVPELVDNNLKRRFIAGLADTIGSTKSTHRRFSKDKQMVSFEISGFAYEFVCSLCKLLHSIGCYPDQLHWNHPNFHCGSNPYDKKWKKGFKLRVYLDQYEKFGAFAFMSKALSARENRELEKDIENVGIPCEERRIRTPSVACVHQEEDSPLLPELIRGGHYLHNRHVCAVLGCPHAPYREVEKLLDKAEYCINPFPVLVKGTEEEICRIVKMDPIMKNRSYCSVEMKVADLYSRPESSLLYGDGKESGYPLNKILLGVTYLIAAETGQLNGSRPKGSKNQIISEYLQDNPDGSVTIELPELLTPLLIHSNGFGVLVGPQNPAVYRKLIQRCPESPYKIRVRKIKEEDLQ